MDLGHARHSIPRSNVRSDEATIRTTRRPFHPGKLVPAIFAQPCMMVPIARIALGCAETAPVRLHACYTPPVEPGKASSAVRQCDIARFTSLAVLSTPVGLERRNPGSNGIS